VHVERYLALHVDPFALVLHVQAPGQVSHVPACAWRARSMVREYLGVEILSIKRVWRMCALHGTFGTTELLGTFVAYIGMKTEGYI
jgi:hypothetical protein